MVRVHFYIYNYKYPWEIFGNHSKTINENFSCDGEICGEQRNFLGNMETHNTDPQVLYLVFLEEHQNHHSLER
jgi:hypothetical protein